MPLPPFENRYKRTHVKTDKDCWTCRKTTTTCLLTDNYATGGDFLYTCQAHLKDRNFASPLESEPEVIAKPLTSPSISQSDIDIAIKEYEERNKAKEAASGSANEETKEAEKNKKSKATDKKKEVSIKASQPSSPPPVPPEPTYYQLHKSFFDMRLRLHQQKQQAKEVQARRSKLNFPSAPSARPGADAKPAS